MAPPLYSLCLRPLRLPFALAGEVEEGVGMRVLILCASSPWPSPLPFFLHRYAKKRLLNFFFALAKTQNKSTRAGAFLLNRKYNSIGQSICLLNKELLVRSQLLSLTFIKIQHIK